MTQNHARRATRLLAAALLLSSSSLALAAGRPGRPVIVSRTLHRSMLLALVLPFLVLPLLPKLLTTASLASSLRMPLPK